MQSMVNILGRWLLLGALICVNPVLAAGVEDQFGSLQAQFMAAEAGAEEQIEPVEAGFAALLKTDPANPLFQAYHGAAVAMKSRTTLLPWKKIGYAKEGLAEIDTALKALASEHDRRQLRGVPLSLETRLVAAGTFLALPESFDRRAAAADLLRRIQATPSYQSSPAAFRAATLIRVAEMDGYNANAAERQTHLRAAADLDPAGPYGKRAKQMLSEAE